MKNIIKLILYKVLIINLLLLLFSHTLIADNKNIFSRMEKEKEINGLSYKKSNIFLYVIRMSIITGKNLIRYDFENNKINKIKRDKYFLPPRKYFQKYIKYLLLKILKSNTLFIKDDNGKNIKIMVDNFLKRILKDCKNISIKNNIVAFTLETTDMANNIFRIRFNFVNKKWQLVSFIRIQPVKTIRSIKEK